MIVDKFTKILISISPWLIMNYQSSNFGSEGSWNKNVKKSLEVEISLKIHMIFFIVC